jgi:hypothetical protein
MYYPNMPYRRDAYTDLQQGIILPERMDNSRVDDDEDEYNYFKSMCPEKIRKIMGYVEEKCNELDYDGSMMYDELPDRERVNYVVDEIFDKIKWMDITPDEIILPEMLASQLKADKEAEKQTENQTENQSVEMTTVPTINRYYRGGDGIRSLVRILFLNELMRRRRRHGFPRRYRRRGYPFYWIY